MRMIGLHHCDKNGPAFAMALARTNYPGLIVNGGSIMPGCHKGHSTSILDVYDAAAKEKQGTMSYEESEQIIRTACPGAGGCGIAASFNTWGIALEALGLSLPDTSSMPAVEAGKTEECLRVGKAVRRLLELNLRPRGHHHQGLAHQCHDRHRRHRRLHQWRVARPRRRTRSWQSTSLCVMCRPSAAGRPCCAISPRAAVAPWSISIALAAPRCC
jgi:hypothetical protein